jgi:hypothetical protein
MKLRIQIAIYHTLVCEMVGESEEVHQFWVDWCNTRNRAGFDMGGSIIQLASQPRVWDVLVGSTITRNDDSMGGQHE